MKLFGFVVMLITSMVVSNIYADGEIVSADQQQKLLGFVLFCWFLTLVLAWTAWNKFRSDLAKRREAFGRSSTKPSLFGSRWDRDDHDKFWERPNKS